MIEMNEKLYDYTESLDKEIFRIMDKHNYSKTNKPKGHFKVNNTIVSYDSETTNYIDKEGNKKPFQYAEMLTILNPETEENINLLIRDHKILAKLLNKMAKHVKARISWQVKTKGKDKEEIKDAFGLPILDESDNTYLDVFIHNQSFDNSFMWRDFKWYKVFLSKSHTPYYAITTTGIRFRDSVVMSQMTLNMMGKSLTEHSVRKQVGDLDYNLIRNKKTTFTDTEKGYLVNDVLVLTAWIDEKIKSQNYDGKIAKLQLTKTGEVRQFIKDVCSYKKSTILDLAENGLYMSDIKSALFKYLNNGSGRLQGLLNKQKSKYQKLIEGLTLDYQEYHNLKEAFQGGFTHANHNYVGKTIKNVRSFDFTSSYPTVLVSEKFPMRSGEEIKAEDMKFDNPSDPEKYDYGYMFKATFRHLREKTNIPDHYLSISKAFDIKGQYQEDNGRIVMINECSFYLTDIDMWIIDRCYDYDSVHYEQVYRYKMDYLPVEFVASVLHFYKQKTTLKHVAGKQKFYQMYKGMLNSTYGMTVMDVVKQQYMYNQDDNVFEKKDITLKDNFYYDTIDMYNTSKKRVLFYPWGVWTTCWARRNLWTGILECGQDYIYSDTDSIKIKNYEKHMKYVEQYNKNVTDKINKVVKLYKFNEDVSHPMDINGNEHQLGVWDVNDGNYSYFKTLGAKRYIDIDADSHEFSITIAGLSKSSGAKYLLEKAKIPLTKDKEGNYTGVVKHYKDERNEKRLFKLFNDKMHVPAGRTGKLAHYYIDNYEPFYVTDYQGHKDYIDQTCGCLLQSTDFTLNMSTVFEDYLLNFGYMKLTQR